MRFIFNSVLQVKQFPQLGLRQYFPPVQCVKHLDSDEHRQGHGGGIAGLKYFTVDALEHRIFLSTLHEVTLHRNTRHRSGEVKPHQHKMQD